MNKVPFVSIIVPVYNTPAPILKTCFDSVRNQSNTNWELIIIDDGSSKECAECIDFLCADMPNTTVVHKENGGVSSARNVGINKARGEWITFLDSDNSFPIDALQIYYDAVGGQWGEDTDMVIGFCARGRRAIENERDVISLNVEKEMIKKASCTTEIIKDKNELINHCLTQRVKRWTNRTVYFADGPFSKLVKNQLAKSILFPLNLQWGEDTVWLLDFVAQCNKILIIPDIVYNNIEYKLSATRRYRPDCQMEFYETSFTEKGFEKKFPLCAEPLSHRRFVDILVVARLYFFHKDNPKSTKVLYREFCIWCKNEETQSVAKDVLRTMKKNDIRSFVFRAFSLCLLLGLYRLCWMALKIYCKRR